MFNRIKSFQSVMVMNLALSVGSMAAGSQSNQSFKNFVPAGDANWIVDEEQASADSGNGFLLSQTSYADFYLRVEFQVASKSNSGIFLRCASREEINDKTCYEVNIFDTRPDQEFRTGAVTGYSSPKAIINTEDGQWHVYEIFAVGDQLRVLLDGRETVSMRNEKHKAGPVALQRAAGAVQFRNLIVEF